MLVAVQFPICDSRVFAESSSRLAVPDWPSPRTDLYPQFVRYFGPAARRRLGANPAWFDEGIYCSAKRALRFPTLGDRPLPRLPTHVAGCAFRRLFSNGRSTARIEVGISLSSDYLVPRLSAPQLLGGVQDVLELPTQVPGAQPRAPLPLVAQGPALADLYHRGSSKLAPGSADEGRGLVEAGAPLAVVELDERPALPRRAVVIEPESVQGTFLAFTRVRTTLGVVGCWFLARHSAEPGYVRTLRLTLLRLHAEQETLDLVLKHLQRGTLEFKPGTEAGELVEAYLNEMTKTLGKFERFRAPQAKIVSALAEADRVAYRNSDELMNRLSGVRAQIRQKIAKYEEERRAVRSVPVFNVEEGGVLTVNEQNISGGTFYGPVVNQVVADHIEKSFNTINQAAVDEDLKQALMVLHEEVKQLTGDMTAQGEGDPARLAEAMETFTDQATKEKPFGEVVRAAGREIVDAVSGFAERATPVLRAVNAVLGLVGVAALV